MNNPIDDLSPPSQSPFERIRQLDDDNQEFWSARDLMFAIEYTN